jgi:hypothetical protein
MKTATSARELSKERVRRVTRSFDLHDCDALVDLLISHVQFKFSAQHLSKLRLALQPAGGQADFQRANCNVSLWHKSEVPERIDDVCSWG